MLRASYWVLSKKHIIQNTITTTIFINYSTKAFRSKANNKHLLKHTKWKQQPIIFIQKNILYTNMVKTSCPFANCCKCLGEIRSDKLYFDLHTLIIIMP